MNNSNKIPTNDSWDTYWQGTGTSSAFSCGGSTHPEIEKFWCEFWDTVVKNYTHPKIIDVASGNGTVIKHAISRFATLKYDITSLDISQTAINNICNQFPYVNGIIASVNSLPFSKESYNIVTSQYGVEYGGLDAIFETAELVAQNGTLALLLHIQSGVIHQECRQNFKATKALLKSQFIPLAIQMFDEGFKAVISSSDSNYKKALANFAPAISKLEKIIQQFGQSIVNNTFSQLYHDVRHVHQQILNYNPDDVSRWLSSILNELEAYAERMSTMCQSAINSQQFAMIQSKLITQGFSIESAEPLFVSNYKKPIALILLAKKQTTVPSAKKVST